MDTERLLELLLKREEGIITMIEQRELAGLINGHPLSGEAVSIVADLFRGNMVPGDEISSEELGRSVNKINARIAADAVAGDSSRKVIKWMRRIAVAASVILAIGAGVFWLGQRTPKNALVQLIVTEKASKSSLILPDGSSVWVNAETKLSIGKRFGTNSREVYLDGEAYFDVIKDENRPFIVHTRDLDIKVLGTAFDVRAYQKEQHTETSLFRGRVEVLLKGRSKKTLVLQPHEKIVVQNEQSTEQREMGKRELLPEITILRIEPNVADSGFLETQWMRRNISFDHQPLKEIIPMLEKWYEVRITVNNPSLFGKRFSAKIEQEGLEEVLESFRLSSGIRYRIDKSKKEVTIE
jgi:ferric-dicitrate binding protein FerR (iron transport regulator)